jgi:hypothetical protein
VLHEIPRARFHDADDDYRDFPRSDRLTNFVEPVGGRRIAGDDDGLHGRLVIGRLFGSGRPVAAAQQKNRVL